MLDRIGDRWTILIIGAMADGEPVRFTDLLHTIEGISQKMLTKKSSRARARWCGDPDRVPQCTSPH